MQMAASVLRGWAFSTVMLQPGDLWLGSKVLLIVQQMEVHRATSKMRKVTNSSEFYMLRMYGHCTCIYALHVHAPEKGTPNLGNPMFQLVMLPALKIHQALPSSSLGSPNFLRNGRPSPLPTGG